MKIVILDGHTTNPGDLSWAFLNEYGDVSIYDRTPKELIIERSLPADILITNKTPLPKSILEQLPNLKYVALLSTGYNIADTDYLKERGIPVSNIPDYSTEAVAQHVFAFILEHYNSVALHSEAVRGGEWSICPDFCFLKGPVMELMGKTIGIIGFGKIGRSVAEKALAFKMNVIAYTPNPKKDADFVEFVSLDELAERSDIVTIHTPLTDATRGFINRDFIFKMKKGAFLVNTSRGPVIDEQAQADALNSGHLAGAGLDVLSTEPPSKDNPLLTAQNCFITPHIAWAGRETRARLLSILNENIKAFVNGKPQNVVNM
ncbi:MAG TPA: D-2-hydroxyacid dehydrogenase [Clostridiales bacterium]|nr:D-2-hydroxyacid dehydrogenase [Clostridiales bacterium]